MTHTEETKVGNYIVRTYIDENTESPRMWDNFGTMVCFHRRYNLGDKHSYNQNDYTNWKEMKKALLKDNDAAVILPLYLYDHSGITISTSPFNCGWDSGQVGYIFVSKVKILEEYGGKIVTKKLKDRAEKLLISEVQTYDTYLTGEVYGYKVFEVITCDKGFEHEQEIDSCCGFYGEDECMKEGIGVAEHYVKI